MSDKNYTPASGFLYEVKKNAQGGLDVKKSGDKKGSSVSVELTPTPIDSQTKRVLRSHGENRDLFWVYAKGNKRILSWPGGSIELEASEGSENNGAGGGALKPLKLTMPGKVLSVKVKEGDLVEANQGLVIVEAMKMENLLLAPAKAKVTKVMVKEGDRLESGATLLTFGPAE